MVALNGSRLRQIYGNSPYYMLSTLYPEYEWLPWKFRHTTKGFWEDPKNCKWFLEWSKPFLGIKNNQDWEKVSRRVRIKKNAGN